MQSQLIVYSRWALSVPLFAFGLMYVLQASTFHSNHFCALPGTFDMWLMVAGTLFFGLSLLIYFYRFVKFVSHSAAFSLIFFAAALYIPDMGIHSESIQLSSLINMTKDMVLAGGAIAYTGLANVKL